MTTLRDILESLKGDFTIALDDGATKWFAESLIPECGELELEEEVYIDAVGIYFEGGNYPAYKFIYGVWDEDTGEFIRELENDEIF